MEEGEEKKAPQEEEKENDPVFCQAYASMPKAPIRIAIDFDGARDVLDQASKMSLGVYTPSDLSDGIKDLVSEKSI